MLEGWSSVIELAIWGCVTREEEKVVDTEAVEEGAVEALL
jgi:hypothetical protein